MIIFKADKMKITLIIIYCSFFVSLIPGSSSVKRNQDRKFIKSGVGMHGVNVNYRETDGLPWIGQIITT